MPRRRGHGLPAVLFSLAGFGLASLAPRFARADSCVAPDLLDTIPADMSTGVPTNASLFAQYQTNAQYQEQPVTIDEYEPSADGGVDGGMGTAVVTGQAIPATFDPTSGLLQITPLAGLTPGDLYVVHWPALTGIDTASLGTSADTHFTAGSTMDTQAPTFAGLSSVSWNVSRQSDSCNSDIDQRYVFNLGLGAAADDGGRDFLTVLVFQTAGPDIDADAATTVLVQPIPPEGQGVTVTTDVQVGHVCFAAIVRDLTMKVSTSGAPVCVDTVSPPFFYSCGVGRGRAPRPAGLVAVALAALASTRRMSTRTRRVSRRRRGDGP
jgi:hypothetical protein